MENELHVLHTIDLFFFLKEQSQGTMIKLEMLMDLEALLQSQENVLLLLGLPDQHQPQPMAFPFMSFLQVHQDEDSHKHLHLQPGPG